MASVLENNIQFGAEKGPCTHPDTRPVCTCMTDFSLMKSKKCLLAPLCSLLFLASILLLSLKCLHSFPHSSPTLSCFFGFLRASGGKSAITYHSDADLRSERDAGEILDTLLLLHVLCYQLLWKGSYWHWRDPCSWHGSNRTFSTLWINLWNTFWRQSHHSSVGLIWSQGTSGIINCMI